MDQAENAFQHRTVARRGKRRSGKKLNKSFHSRSTSGTCNVCSAPCFSCMHHNQTASVMESNADGEPSEECSFANSVVLPSTKSRLLVDQKYATSEVRNLHSTSSSHDSSCENAESKANVRMVDIQSEDVDMPLQLSCLVEVVQDDLGKSLDQHSGNERFVSQRDTNVLTMQGDSILAVPKVAKSIEGNVIVDGPIELITGATEKEVNPFTNNSCDRAAGNLSINANNDIEKVIGNCSAEVLSDIPNQQNAINILKEHEALECQTRNENKIDNENNESESLEDDVKVCDICGDVGREEKLAICSRCSDGAEHTYCMRIMLVELPEGNWLCEECKLKEDAGNKANNKESGDFLNTPVPSLDSRQAAAIKANKASQSFDSAGKKSPISTGNCSELNTSTEIARTDALPSAIGNHIKPSLVCDVSFKTAASKLKSGNNISHPQNQPAASSLASFSPKLQARQPLSCGTSLKSAMDNTRPKGKKIMESLKAKEKSTPESSVVDEKKERSQTIVRSESFRGQGTNSLNVDLPGKSHSTGRMDSQTMLVGKQKGALERKSSFLLERSQSNLCATPLTNVTSLKLEAKGFRPEGKCEKASILRGVNDTQGPSGVDEMRKQVPCTPKSSGVAYLSKQSDSKDHKLGQVITKEESCLTSAAGEKGSGVTLQHGLSQSELCAGHDDKKKEIVSGSRQLQSGPGRNMRCQRCNEMGHLTPFCAIDRVRLCALKPSGERNSRDVANKSSKWRHAVEATILNTRIQRNNGSPNDLVVSNNNLSREISSKDLQSNPTVQGRNTFTPSGTKSSGSNDVQQPVSSQVPVVSQAECTPASRDSTSNIAGRLNPKSMVQTCLSEQASLHTTSFSTLAIPQLDYIWQGCFDVQKNGRVHDKFNGVQAHLSTFASPKVIEVVNKFPNKIQLEEVSCISAWPSQFQINRPTEENVALFFFASDAESYEKSYKRLLENMLKNDLALKGNVDGVELLIFLSNKLPENSQRWNRLFFLWGVFKANKPDLPVVLSALQNKSCGDSLETQNFAHSQALTTESNKLIPEACEQVDKEVPLLNEAVKCENFSCKDDGSTSDQISLHQNSLLLGQKLTSDSAITEENASVDDCAKQIDRLAKNEQFKGRKDDDIFQKGINNAARGDNNDSIQTCGIKGQSMEDKGFPMHTDVAIGRQDILPGFNESTQPKYSVAHENFAEAGTCMGIKSNERSGMGTISSRAVKAHVSGMESPGWGSRDNLKRTCSSSPERIAQVFTSTDESAPHKGRGHLPDDSRRESKKMKLFTDENCSTGIEESVGHRLSSIVHPVQGSFLGDARKQSAMSNENVFSEGSSSEMVFFPVGSSTCEPQPQPSSFISFPVVSTVVEDAQVSDMPNLDLALGGERKPKADIMPLFFSLPIRDIDEGKPPDAGVDNGDVSASLSLSLAFPSLEEQQAPKKTAQLPPERARSSMPLFLFGRSPDS